MKLKRDSEDFICAQIFESTSRSQFNSNSLTFCSVEIVLTSFTVQLRATFRLLLARVRVVKWFHEFWFHAFRISKSIESRSFALMKNWFCAQDHRFLRPREIFTDSRFEENSYWYNARSLYNTSLRNKEEKNEVKILILVLCNTVRTGSFHSAT